MTTITIATIIPLYNGSAFIRDALESVLAQSWLSDEIIVVDDGSKDDGPAIVEAMAKVHPITLLRKPNGGQSSARNFAAEHCRSSHIALLDQDDIWYPDHLVTLRQPFIDAAPEDRLAVVYGNLDHVDEDGKMVAHNCLDIFCSTHPKTTLRQCLQEDMFILPGASLIKKSAFLAAGKFDERLSGYEDDDFFLRLFREGYRSVYVDHAVTKWRIHAGSTSYSLRMAVSRMIYYRKLVETYPNEPRLHQFWVRDQIAPRFFRSVVGDYINGSKAGDMLRMDRCWADMRDIAPELPRRPRRRFRRVAPLIDLVHRARFTNLARMLLRYAISDRRKARVALPR
ncbi:glycosyltransferase [Kaistia defluvii]|uniref:glycosyltransferase family 2 protein n=1 Tax=Kaistia defluvii TaxID=410841 RepID=UPI002254F96C|nr:glycosyltransferase [Kaistia defluvii]MCX5521193.1 glycosyltransferase [Kaistia defluvii]